MFSWFGAVSCSVYLTHQTTLGFSYAVAKRIMGHGWLSPVVERFVLWGFPVSGAVAVSAITFYLIESPSHKLGRKLSKYLSLRT